MTPRAYSTRTLLLASLALTSVAAPLAAQTATNRARTEPRARGEQRAVPGSLQRFAAVKVILLPVQTLRAEGHPAWRVRPGRDTVVTRAVDRALEDVMGERGLAKQLVFVSQLHRAAQRNPTYLTDPYDVRAAEALRAAARKPQDAIGEPLVSQLRALAGVSDARYAIVPVELRFESGADSSGHAVLRVATVDTRAAQLLWIGEVAGDDVATFSTSVISGIAQRFADLVVPR